MIRALITVFAALAGLAFGSFLNVCLSRWPKGESVVKPRSHCRNCGRTLTWWENIPLLSWLALRGHCSTCKSPISWRYPAVEFAVAALWGCLAWQLFAQVVGADGRTDFVIGPAHLGLIPALASGLFLWMMVGIAVLDAEHFWIADAITIPGTVFGLALPIFNESLMRIRVREQFGFWRLLGERLLAVILAALLILAIRWLYWLIRRREGIGLGDAKLMAMLAAWLGLPGALLSFAIGVILGAIVGIIVLARGPRAGAENPALAKLPLGTFLSIGGIISSLWGQPIIAAYMRYAGFN